MNDPTVSLEKVLLSEEKIPSDHMKRVRPWNPLKGDGKPEVSSVDRGGNDLSNFLRLYST